MTVTVPSESKRMRKALREIEYLNRLITERPNIPNEAWDAYSDAWWTLQTNAPELYDALAALMDDTGAALRGYETWSNWFGPQMIDPMTDFK